MIITKAQRAGLAAASEAYGRVYQEGVRLDRINPGEEAVKAAVAALGFKIEDAKPVLFLESEEQHG